jgi:hypothetical protein
MGNDNATSTADLQRAIWSAVRAKQARDEFRLAALTAQLVATNGGRAAIEASLSACLQMAWQAGWQPLDVAHVVARHDGPLGRVMVLAAMGRERAETLQVPLDDRWQDQLDQLEVTVSRKPFIYDTADGAGAIAILAILATIGKLSQAIPSPGSAAVNLKRAPRTNALDEKILAKVRALLAKAESSTFEEEAHAFTEKAQQLMARHSIDLAMVHAQAVHSAGANVEERRVHLDDPYVASKIHLLGVVSNKNRCRTVSLSDVGIVGVFGAPADLDIVVLLFTSLLTQATASMIAAGRCVDGLGRSQTRSFRQSFLAGFAFRISERLAAGVAAANHDARSTIGDSFVPVLIAQEQAIQRRLVEAYPSTVKRRARTVSNASGWHAGRAAADRATINGEAPRGSLRAS